MDVEASIIDALLEVAPEVDLADIDRRLPLPQQLDLDSMDFLALLEGVAERTVVEVPEYDYEQVATLDGLAAYVERQRLRPAAG